MRQRVTWLRLLASAVVAVVCAGSGLVAQPAATPSEVRALWVLRTSLTSRDSIASLIRHARDNGFNTLFVQVRGRGDAYYRGGLEPVPAALERQPDSYDPLAVVLDLSHAAGIKVHAWVNVNLVSSAVQMPTAREHLVYRHPEWLMVPRDIAQELAAVPTDSPAYLGRLARWTRQQSDDVEGLYSSPVHPAGGAYVEAVVRDLVKRYAIDGIHFDYARYPTERFDYSQAAINEFRAAVRPQIDDAKRRALDAEHTLDLFAYPDALPEAWRTFRIGRMTELMTRLGRAAHAERPALPVSVAAAPDRQEALDRRLQDWGTWLSAGIVDALAPMAYTQEPARFAEQIAAARQIAGSRAVWAGIGAYRLSAAQTIQNIETARKLGAAGVILFSYDSLINPRETAPDYLPTVGRTAFGTPTSSAGSR